MAPHISIHPTAADRLVVRVLGSRFIMLEVGGSDTALFLHGEEGEAVSEARALASALIAAANELEIDLNTRAYLAQHPNTKDPQP